MSDIFEIKREDYLGLLFDLRRELLLVPCLYSAIVYGSVARLEHIPGMSDIDVLVVIEESFLDNRLVIQLNRIVGSLFQKWHIKIHLRIRNLNDLECFSSGMLDCGVTSSINKLRDSILLCGRNLDFDYLRFLSSVGLPDLELNIKMRLSDIRYQIRALVSTNSDPVNLNNLVCASYYKLGCVIYQVAEVVCYANGVLYINAKDALIKAQGITGNTLFSEALSIKQCDGHYGFAEVISSLDKIAGSVHPVGVTALLERIHRIEYKETISFPSFAQTRRKWEQVLKSYQKEEPHLYVKASSIGPDGFLTVNRLRV